MRKSRAQTRWGLRRLKHLGAILAWAGMLTAGTAPFNEYQVKAAFVYNFIKFVEWPPQHFKSASDPILICVLGDDPFGNLLEGTLNGKTIDARSFLVRRTRDARETGTCDVVFVSSSEKKNLTRILAELKNSAALSIGDSEGFAAQGGIIDFKLEGGRVRFEINVEAAKQQGLHISSKLLSLAEIVKRGSPEAN